MKPATTAPMRIGRESERKALARRARAIRAEAEQWLLDLEHASRKHGQLQDPSDVAAMRRRVAELKKLEAQLAAGGGR